jgi:hypothetical protein
MEPQKAAVKTVPAGNSDSGRRWSRGQTLPDTEWRIYMNAKGYSSGFANLSESYLA